MRAKQGIIPVFQLCNGIFKKNSLIAVTLYYSLFICPTYFLSFAFMDISVLSLSYL